MYESIGQILRKKRLELDMPLEQIEFETKLSLKKLNLIEQNKFDQIDNHFYNKAYIKIYAKLLGISSEMLLAIYKRDFENIAHKREVKKKEQKPDKSEVYKAKLQNISEFIFTPKKIAFFVFLLIIVFTGSAAYTTAKKALKIPYLKITTPVEITANYSGKLQFEDSEVTIKGETESGNIIKINDVPVDIHPGFQFESDPIALVDNETQVKITATNQIGKKSDINLIIVKYTRELKDLNLVIKPTSDGDRLTIKADSVIKFDDNTKSGDSIAVTAEHTLEIKCSNPSNLLLTLNSVSYELKSNQTIFTIEENKIVQK